MSKLSIRDLEMSGKRVFIRVDFNVPLDGGRVTDDTRIRETLPTLEFARERGARLVLASHLGRPKGKPDPKYSLRPVAAKLAELLGACRWNLPRTASARKPKRRAARSPMAACCCSKTCATTPRKKPTTKHFSRQLAALCDGMFVCDAFGSAHRAHASVVGITRFVKQAAAGLLMERELAYLGKALSNPERPFVAVLGGAKVSDKIEVVENLMKVADAMLIGGGMAYTFLKSQGLPIGKSLVEDGQAGPRAKAARGSQSSEISGCCCRPITCWARNSSRTRRRRRPASPRRPTAGWGWTSGRRPSQHIRAEIARAKTIVWNGPMGVFEMPAFAKGTLEIARAVAAATAKGATSIVGGGDSVAAIHAAGWPTRFRTFRRAAARRSNFWLAENCRASRR